MNIINILEKTSKKYTNKPALVFNGEELSFSQLYSNTKKLAQALRDVGISKGDKVSVYLPNCCEFITAYLASFFLGAVCVPLDFMLKEDELKSCLIHSESKVFITLSDKSEMFLELKKSVGSLENIIAIGQPIDGTLNYHTLVNVCDGEIFLTQTQDFDPALIMYTSGTTGKPKGILLNHKHLEGSPLAMERFVDLSDEDVKLVAIPLSHIGGFVYLQNCIYFGITLILMSRFHPMKFLKCIEDYKVTCFHIVPPMYTAILTLKSIEKYDLSSLRWMVVFGAPSSPEILERFHKYCPNAKLLNGWGMTETCPPNTVTPLGSDNIASVGKPAPHCDIRILDEDDCEVAIGTEGEITISGWIVMDGYYKDDEATEKAIKNGRLYTGDIGKFDNDGYLYIVGRKKEMIKVAGQIVYAPEVESVFYRNEDVVEVAVIGVEDKLKGEAVKAFIVLKEGSDLLEEDLRAFARDHLANFKVPQIIKLREELPKNRTGKIDKALLKAEALTVNS